MKPSLLFLFTMLLSICYSQDFKLLESKREKNGYSYRLRVLNTLDSSSYSVVSNSEKFYEFQVLNNDGQPLNAEVNIKNIVSNTIQNYNCDFEGYCKIELPPANYIIEIFDYVYNEPIQISLSINETIGQKFTIRLGKGPDLYPKIIYSKRKLDSENLNLIVNCITKAKKIERCSEECECIIMTEI